jgi:hypothetical protein
MSRLSPALADPPHSISVAVAARPQVEVSCGNPAVGFCDLVLVRTVDQLGARQVVADGAPVLSLVVVGPARVGIDALSQVRSGLTPAPDILGACGYLLLTCGRLLQAGRRRSEDL